MLLKKFKTAADVFLKKGPKGIVEKIQEKRLARNYIIRINQQYLVWYKNHYPSKDVLLKQEKELDQMKKKPLISIVMPVYNPNILYFRECIESVLAQSYENWQLCMVDDCSPNEEVREIIKEYAAKDKRIVYTFRKKNGHICAASNDAIALAKGEWIALLDNDDILWPNALYENVKLINKKSSTQFIYSDEDKIEEDGVTHCDPFFKPDWSPDYLRSINYITHFAVIKKPLIDSSRGFRLGYEGAQDWDLFLRITNELTKKGHCHPLDSENPIQHIQTVLYSWRKSPTSTASQKHIKNAKPYAFTAQKKALEDDLKQRGYKGAIEETKYIGLWRVRYEIKGSPLVSIIIPTKNQYSYIKRCLDSILKKSTYKNYELVIVDTGSTDEKVFELYQEVKRKHNNTLVLNWDKPFNFSAACNFGAKGSRGKYLLFLNNDTEVITPNWIESMLEHAQRPEVGAVGAKLLYPNGSIQHAGIVLGIGRKNDEGIAGHLLKSIHDLSDDFFKVTLVNTVRNMSGVTAACLLVSRQKFEEANMFDETLAIAFNDVDLNIKLLQKYTNIYTPYSVLYHHESVSVGLPGEKKRSVDLFKREREIMKKRWGKLVNEDYYYNENFNDDSELIFLIP